MSAAGPEHHAHPEPASGSPRHNHDHGQPAPTARLDHADSRHSGAPDHHVHTTPGEHDHPSGLRGLLANLLQPHSHDAADSVDDALAGSSAGIRAVKLSLLGLGLTAALQLVVVLISGSAALLADTIHNFADAATAFPLWLAFAVGRRPPTRRYSYGFGRAEDLAGVFVVLMIAASSVLAAWESLQKLLQPQPINQLGWVAAAAVVGCLGNELVAQYRIRIGQRIGSAALVADGYHARTDGLTSLAVLIGVVGVWLGFPQADPLIGLVITVAILFVLKNAVVQIWQRLMDAIDPALLERAEIAARAVSGVQSVDAVRARWIGHTIYGEGWITADRDLTLAAAHEIAEQARHAMLHAVPKLADVAIHVDPCTHDGSDPHDGLAHHDPRSSSRPTTTR
jgi:cation diffusion facilitator family transporter